jgi:uncharacterized protein YecT (DUF1311 family)
MRLTFVHTAFFGLALLVAQTDSAGAQNRNVRGCLSITDVNARVDCLEGQTQPPTTSVLPIPSDVIRRPMQIRVVPSFDCRAAASSIERAICSDDELAGWDARMGQAFQRALRLQKDSQLLLEDQRRWIILRDRTCGSTSEIPMSCLLGMTKQRTSALSEIAPTDAAAAAQQPPAPQAITSQASVATDAGRQPEPIPSPPAPSSSLPDNRPKVLLSPNIVVAPQISAQTNKAAPTHQDGGPSPIIVLLGIGVAIWLAVKVLQEIQKKQRRQSLIAKYGEADTDRILAGEVWMGMTNEQLIDAWGNPVEVGQEVSRNKTKETWKSNQTGKNRFSNRISLENGIVSGWKN